MPGAHSYLQYTLTLQIYTKLWPRIMDSAGKRSSQQGTGARAATAGPCCSCQQDSLAACKLVVQHDDPGAHGMNRGQSKMNGGKNVEKGSGHGMAKASRHTACRTRHCRQTQPAEQALQADTASGFSARHRPLNKQTAHSWPASQQ